MAYPGQGPDSFSQISSLRINEDLQKRVMEAQVRMAKTNFVRVIEESAGAYSLEQYYQYLNSLIQAKCALSFKYQMVPIQDILFESCQTDGLKRLNEALNILEKYGKNLLKPLAKRPPMWKTVMFANGVFSEKVDWMKNGRQILRMYGYTVSVTDGLSFPDDKEPILHQVAKVLADLLLAKEEIRLYMEGQHPQRCEFEQHIPVNDRISNDPSRNGYRSDIPASEPLPESKQQEQRDGPAPGSRLPPVIRPNTHTNHHAPFSAVIMDTPPPVKTVMKPPEPGSPPPGGIEVCDICGQETVSFVCEVCDNKGLCKECDEKWHKHPRRVHHKRKESEIKSANDGIVVSTNSPASSHLPASPSQPASREAGCSKETKSQIIKVIPGRGIGERLGRKELPNNLPNLPIFNITLTNSTPSNSEEILSNSNRNAIDLRKEIENEGIKMHTSLASSAIQSCTSPYELSHGDRPVPSVSHAVSSNVFSMQSTSYNASENQSKPSIQDILNITNFENKRIKLEALIIEATTEMKQIEEQMQFVIMSHPNFLDDDLYKDLIKRKERLLKNLQIFEGYRRMFEEEEKVRRLVQQSQEDVVFHKSICLPPGDSYIPPTTKASRNFKPSPHQIVQKKVQGPMTESSLFSVPHSMPYVIKQTFESSPWHIATNILGASAEYKGICPNCSKVTNYYNDVCHICKQKIPMDLKAQILPPHALIGPNMPKSSITQGSLSPSYEAQSKIDVRIENMSSTPSDKSRRDNTESITKKREERIPPSNKKYGLHPKRWMCEHCTYENEAMTRVCIICDRTSDNPKYTEDPSSCVSLNITDDDKWNSGGSEGKDKDDLDESFMQERSLSSPRNVAINFQHEAELMAEQKRIAREEFRRMMEEEEQKKKGKSLERDAFPSNEAAGLVHDKPVGYDDTDASLKRDVYTNKCAENNKSLKTDYVCNDLNKSDKVVIQKEKYDLQKQLEDIAIKKQQEETIMLSRETVRLIRLAENQGYTFDELNIALKQNNDSDPLVWLEESWQELIAKVISMASESTEDSVFGDVTEQEAKSSLIQMHGDMESATQNCVQERQKKIEEICKLSGWDKETASDALLHTNGDIDEALDYKSRNDLNRISERLWTNVNNPSSSTTTTTAHVSSSLGARNPPSSTLGPSTEVVIKDKNVPFERRARIVLVEGRMQGWGRAENVLRILEQDGDVSVNDVIEAVSNCGNISDSLRYLQQECQTCYCSYPVSKMLSLPLCQCKLCIDCLRSYFEVQVREKHVRDMICPSCQQPDIQNEGQAETHFTFISVLLKSLLTEELNELFLEKLRDWRLMQEPNFRWCSMCACGFIFNDEGQLKMRCPDCNGYTCFACKKPWEKQHEGRTCDEYATWKKTNDPELQAAGLAKHLEENGIDCPECKFRYALAKGGCMHFKCTQCRHEFCSGCYKPFKRGENCRMLRTCAKAGLHCHHPRDCLFYLRDFDVKQLQNLLKDNTVEFNTTNGTTEETGSRCPVMEQKELPNGYKDEACGKDAPDGHAGLCQLHYKEYLVSLINKNYIDPVNIMNIDELKNQCGRYGKNMPHKKRRESADQYRFRVIEFIQQEIPLHKRNNDSESDV